MLQSKSCCSWVWLDYSERRFFIFPHLLPIKIKSLIVDSNLIIPQMLLRLHILQFCIRKESMKKQLQHYVWNFKDLIGIMKEVLAALWTLTHNVLLNRGCFQFYISVIPELSNSQTSPFCWLFPVLILCACCVKSVFKEGVSSLFSSKYYQKWLGV